MPPPLPLSSRSLHTFCLGVDSMFLLKIIYRFGTKPPFSLTVFECFLASRSSGEYGANRNPSSPNLKIAFVESSLLMVLSTCHIAPEALPPSPPQPGIYPRGPDVCWVLDSTQRNHSVHQSSKASFCHTWCSRLKCSIKTETLAFEPLSSACVVKFNFDQSAFEDS